MLRVTCIIFYLSWCSVRYPPCISSSLLPGPNSTQHQMNIADRKEYMMLMIMFFSACHMIGSAPPPVYFSASVHSPAKENARPSPPAVCHIRTVVPRPLELCALSPRSIGLVCTNRQTSGLRPP